MVRGGVAVVEVGAGETAEVEPGKFISDGT